jgi:uncharacterized protein (TIGR03086 family)
MEPLELLRQAHAEFGERLTAVQSNQWDAPTSCGDWCVRDLASHVVNGNHFAVLLLAGTSQEDAVKAFAEPLADDVVAAFEESADAQDRAFAEPDALERTCHHPVGDISGAQFLGFRMGDLTLHAWDLARPLGLNETLRPALVEAIWEQLSPMASFIGQTGVFGDGPSGSVPDNAPLQTRLLDLSGRRP